MKDSIYIDFILKNIPKVITQIDRDEDSKTYGSCDRNHWHLKIRDFDSAILQQSGLALAFLYNLNFKDNIYYKNENIKKWAEATVYYWGKIQLNDGSYNEYYPFEHGFPPTAFSLYSSCETYKILNLKDKILEDKIRNTSKYLVNHIEKQALNQEIASITALYSAYTILKEQWIVDGLNVKLDNVLKQQSVEGWFPEYGGADLGYLSVSFDMLSEYYAMSKDERVLEPLNKIVDFIKYFIHADGTVGGEYGSRNTIYFLPNGIEVMCNLGNENALKIKQMLFENVKKFNYFMDSVDDRYFSHYLLHSFLRALSKENICEINLDIKLPCEEKHEKYFDNSGLVSFNNGIYHSIISLKKGGIIKIFKDKREIGIDCGYRIPIGIGNTATTNWLDETYDITYKNNSCLISGNFNQIKQKVQSPIYHFGLRVVAFLLGNKIINILKKKIILVDNHIDIKFSRTIHLNEEKVLIEDYIYSPNKVTIKKAPNSSLRHVASGKFFTTSDLFSENFEVNNIKKIKIFTEIDIKSERVEIKYEKLE